METKENAKKLGIILCIIIGIILLILAVFFIVNYFKISPSNDPALTTTTTKPIDYGYKDLPKEKKIEYNIKFNKEEFLLALTNAVDNNFNIKNINLLESEINKFKFIYTYNYYLNNLEAITIENLNIYSRELFNTELSENNLILYLNNDNYIFNILYKEVDFCIKVNKEKTNTLLIDMINKDDVNCDINIIDYEAEEIIHQLTLVYEMVDNNFIYKSFIVVK